MAKPAMYERTTRESAYYRLNPAIKQAIDAHIERYELDLITDEPLACIETTSVQRKTGLFGMRSNMLFDPDKENITAALVTPGWFVWGRTAKKSGTVVMSARIDSIEVVPYQNAEVFEDHGIHITGLWTGSVERSRIFLGLGTESDAEEFKQVLKDAVEKAHGGAQP
jgi:hypothetical protein